MQDLKEQVLHHAKLMYERGHVVGAAGNVSVRVPGKDELVITPTRVPYDTMTIEDIVVANFELDVLDGKWAPSFECRLHVAVYQQRDDVGAVVHSHSPHATAHAVHGLTIEPICEELVPYVGGAVETARFGISGSDELIEAALEGLGSKAAVLLRSHGLLGCGKTLEKAFRVIELVEYAAHVSVLAAAFGKAPVLPKDVIETEAAIYEYMKMG